MVTTARLRPQRHSQRPWQTPQHRHRQEVTAPAPTAAAPAAPATAAGIRHFQVAGDSSLASYTTREKFFDQPSPIFVTGTTSAITGDLHLDRTTWQPAADPPSVITVDLRTLQTDSSRRDNAIRGRFLESNTYPMATFVLKRVAGVPQSYQEGTEVTVVLEGDLTVREITIAGGVARHGQGGGQHADGQGGDERVEVRGLRDSADHDSDFGRGGLVQAGHGANRRSPVAIMDRHSGTAATGLLPSHTRSRATAAVVLLCRAKGYGHSLSAR